MNATSMILSPVATALAGILAIAAPAFSQTTTAKAARETPSSTTPRQPTTRFDYLVRPDFFAGMAGNQARFARAMKLCEETLARNPRHAEALVWHGSGLLFLAGQAFRRDDPETGSVLWERGLREMDQAVALEPDNVGVLIPRAATLSAASRAVPSAELVKVLLTQAVADYEKVLAIQAPYFGRLPVHARGELLAGLAEGWHRLGEVEKARGYLRRIVSELPGSPYQTKAQGWLEADHDSAPPPTLSCTGCHIP